ncbi:MAG: BamA/TamA family outer membrane protein [Candidatus Kapabacteria bacterium]|nr:BamA/TamA family outer membrane protein [Candidatus Kapabacteria bacterium]
MQHFTHAFLPCLFLLLSVPSAQAQDSTAAASDNTAAGTADSATRDRSGLAILPFIAYTPETRWAGGGAVIYYSRAEDAPLDSRADEISGGGIYTQNKQLSIICYPEIYWDQGRWSLKGSLGYLQYPTYFYGVGNATRKEDEELYEPRTLRCSAAITRYWDHLMLAVRYEARHDKFLAVDSGGFLEQGLFTGSGGGLVSGAGVIAGIDDRDYTFSTMRGTYVRLTAMGYDGTLGSDFGFGKYTLDARRYWPLFDGHVVAAQAYGEFTSGNAPFYMLSQLGGENRMRGFYEGRYRNNHMLAAQAEYRLPVWWRFGVVGFAGVGAVAPTLATFSLRDVRASAGTGIRFSLDPKERINIRLDFGIGEKLEFYFGIDEAL